MDFILIGLTRVQTQREYAEIYNNGFFETLIKDPSSMLFRNGCLWLTILFLFILPIAALTFLTQKIYNGDNWHSLGRKLLNSFIVSLLVSYLISFALVFMAWSLHFGSYIFYIINICIPEGYFFSVQSDEFIKYCAAMSPTNDTDFTSAISVTSSFSHSIRIYIFPVFFFLFMLPNSWLRSPRFFKWLRGLSIFYILGGLITSILLSLLADPLNSLMIKPDIY